MADEFHRSFDDRLNRLGTESAYPEGITRWMLADWERYARMLKADLRMLETVQLQVEQGLLPEDAMSRPGYNWGRSVGTILRQLIEDSTSAVDRAVCPIDLQKLTDRAILGAPVE